MIDPKVKEAAINDYCEGMPALKVAAKYGFSKSAVQKWVAAAGVVGMNQKKLDKAVVEEAGRRYLAGEDAEKLAQEYGYSSGASIRAMLTAHGYRKIQRRKMPSKLDEDHMAVWVAYSDDKYELPLAVQDDPRDLAEEFGCSVNTIYSCNSHAVGRNQEHSRFRRIVIDKEGIEP